MKRNQVFVSYSHADAEHLARLKVHLRPFERQGVVNVWADTQIGAGQRWRYEIEDALSRAAVGILLVSADFLASDFVVDNELPPLLAAAQAEGVQILPVVLKPCAFLDVPEIAQFQAVNNPDAPVISLAEGEREDLWRSVAIAVRDALAAPRAQQDGEVDQTLVSANQKKELAGERIPVEGYWGLFAEELRDPRVVDDFEVYEYQHLDELSFMPEASSVLGDFVGFEGLVGRLEKRLKKAGWEGDGTLTLLWFPPFVGAGVEDTQGVGVWHVKQSNNGTSWLASPVALPFGRLLEQNR